MTSPAGIDRDQEDTAAAPGPPSSGPPSPGLPFAGPTPVPTRAGAPVPGNTVDAIARLAGVSARTVTRFLERSGRLSEESRLKVARVLVETGFGADPQAVALTLPRSHLVALVHDGSDPAVFGAALAGMSEALANGAYALTVVDLGHGAPLPALRDLLSRHRPAGIVLLPALSGRTDLMTLCAAADVPCVALGPTRNDGCPHFAGDDRGAMAALVSWLVEQGHARIGFVAGPETSLTAQARELGYLDAMADHGLDRGPALIEAGDNSYESGLAAGHLLLEVSPPPTAIIAANAAMAAGVLHAATKAGIAVPGQLSIAGFDDGEASPHTLPPLTTMRVPWSAMANAAVARILHPEADDTASPFRIVAVIRQSVAPMT